MGRVKAHRHVRRKNAFGRGGYRSRFGGLVEAGIVGREGSKGGVSSPGQLPTTHAARTTGGGGATSHS